MSRKIKEDCNRLKEFIANYKISVPKDHAGFSAYISTVHKKYYTLLLVMEKLRHYVGEAKCPVVLSQQQFSFIQEAVSDVGQALFVSFHGCYKGARLLLRSSIENLLKGLCMDEKPNIITTKSVYEVFELAKTTTILSTNDLLDQMHSDYALLCQDVHTAGEDNMVGVAALNYFPNYDTGDAESFQNIILSLVPKYVTVLALKYKTQVNNFDYESVGELMEVVPNEYREQIMRKDGVL